MTNMQITALQPFQMCLRFVHLGLDIVILAHWRIPSFRSARIMVMLSGKLGKMGGMMETIKVFFAQILGSAIGVIGLLVGTLGWAYWMWMAIKLGSFGMFFFGILGPFAMIAGVLGLWSFFFGIPHWLL
jgi:hypothetical protein